MKMCSVSLLSTGANSWGYNCLLVLLLLFAMVLSKFLDRKHNSLLARGRKMPKLENCLNQICKMSSILNGWIFDCRICKHMMPGVFSIGKTFIYRDELLRCSRVNYYGDINFVNKIKLVLKDFWYELEISEINFSPVLTTSFAGCICIVLNPQIRN